MATPVEAPKLGNTVEECVVGRWLKARGDTVSAGELIGEIETDKATFELTSPVSGTVLEIFFNEGALVPVFTNLLVIGEPGENIEGYRPSAASQPAVAEAAVSPATVAEQTAAPVPQQVSLATPAGKLSPRARRFAEEHDFFPSAVVGSGAGGRVLEEDLRQAYLSQPRLSSAAKQQMRDGTPAPGEGSGAGGMVLSTDMAEPGVRISSIREKIARRMRESLASTAQYTMHASADAGGLLTFRARIKASKGVPDININDLVTYCTVQALLQIPELNALFIDGKIYKQPEIHIGFATDTARGLIVPVVRDAHRLAIGELAVRMKDLAAQAVQGSIAADHLSGATFTISNLGGLGIESFTPLLNPPQVAILGVGAIGIKPVRKDGKLEFIDSIGLSLTCDHQVVDGAPGARFLQVLRQKIENVETLCTI